MVIEVMAAADEDGNGGHFGLLLIALVVLVAAALPAVAVVMGAVLLVLGLFRRSDHRRRLAAWPPGYAAAPLPHSFPGAPPRSPSRRADGTVLIVIGTAVLTVGLLGFTVFLVL